jgi:2-octaprenylphenol hydroxylase
MRKLFDIVIVGAGLSGLACAALLAKCKRADQLRVRVIDGAQRPAYNATGEVNLRVSALANGSANLLQSVGAWAGVCAGRISPYERMRVWDENDSPYSRSALLFDAADFAVPQLGHIIENVLLQDALLKVLDETPIELEFETTVESLPSADLVIAADGARSQIRELAGISVKRWPYDQTAVVTHLQPEKNHRRTALQRFLRDGPLGMLPLNDGRVSVVWSTTPQRAGQALRASDAELGRVLSDASDHVLGKLEVAGPRGGFPLSAQHAQNYVKRGIALIGDAAHAVHPLAGQGANLGLQDAQALVRVIDTALAAGLHPADLPVLRRYERSRRGANLTMLHLMTGLNRLFATDSSIAEGLRMAGMRAFNRSGPIRERAVRVALGVS